MHDPWTERLSEYLDKELSHSDREGMERHLLQCRECAANLEELAAVRGRARNLTQAPVPAEVWSGIESGIAKRRIRALPSHEGAERTRGPERERGGRSFWGSRFSFSLPELVAAGLAVAVLSGGGIFALMKPTGSTPKTGPAVAQREPTSVTQPSQSTVGQPPPTGAASEHAGGTRQLSGQDLTSGSTEPSPSVTATDAAVRGAAPRGAIGDVARIATHAEAIDELRKALARERDRLDPSTVRALESNLAIIDLAIDQARRALAADPANSYVKEHLAETMRRKVELLQRATMLASATSEGSP